ncbi:hypothetical protein K505DRAFT_317067 [Melanomma pulvis-pyrius CBS 109.77]|uniref:Glutamyl-tRNA synthetase n=1 Tax=Melanomma pulvis-pyrius CBS 109.77 TaxID=1314802 RepID=A0A6A6WSZ3_9PLEO|nr:hypothetical protein K505DRAFT_317067 [Melanomma pulvis-pyrius CBS 109.77]
MPSPYETALAAIDAAHSEDPTTTLVPDNPTPIPYELLYAQKSTSYLTLLRPNASEALRLAVRAQHFRRWEVPRSSYPMTRIGYHGWRTFLKKRQAELAAAICSTAGLPAETVERVAKLIRKEGLAQGDEETQALEDVACLVFLDDQLEGFEEGLKDDEKVVAILRKSWAKMSPRGHEVALGLKMGDRQRALVEKALAG